MKTEMKQNLDPNMNVEEIIYRILKFTSKKMHYKELIQKAFEVKDKVLTNAGFNEQAASILTDINIDGRFVYFGKGLWGLNDPMTKKPSIKRKSLPLSSRRVESIGFLDAEDEFIEEELGSDFIMHDIEDGMEDHREEYRW
jgi:DNA-directed RNA polymerase delta subunit